jgi:hypothetical protein
VSDLLRPSGQDLQASMAAFDKLAEAVGCTSDSMLTCSANNMAVQALETASDLSLLGEVGLTPDDPVGDAREDELSNYERCEYTYYTDLETSQHNSQP